MKVLERRIQLMRLGASVLGAAQVGVVAGPVPHATTVATFSLLATLGATAVIALVMLSRRGDSVTEHVGAVTLSIDVLVIAGLIAAWGFQPGASGLWALSLLLPVEGAARWGRTGAWGGAIAAWVGFAVAYGFGTVRLGVPHTFAEYSFLAVLLAIVAYTLGEFARRMGDLVARAEAATGARDRAELEQERFEAARGQYTTAIAHEIRTPITALRGFADTIVDRWGFFQDDERQRMLVVLQGQALRLERLVLDLLHLADIEERSFALDRQNMQVGELVARVLEVEGQPPVELLHGGDVEIWCDPLRLETVLDRLISNARTHGEPPVTISAAQVRGGVRITVCDEGPGVPPEIAARILESFVHGEQAKGRGLGLAIASALVGAHGGTLRYERRMGTSCFQLELPDAARTRTSEPDHVHQHPGWWDASVHPERRQRTR